jgi:hypothetical membrane protein
MKKRVIETLSNPRIWTTSGILGSVTAIVMIITPVFFYIGRFGRPYSPLNHYLSELGEAGVSQLAWMFNYGLMLAAILLLPFLIGFGLYPKNMAGNLSSVAGLFTAVSLFLVGVYPMNNRDLHGLTSTWFYFGGLIMTALWTIALLTQKENLLPKGLALGGLVNLSIFFLFLFGPWPLMSIGWDRPDFSMRTTLEWGIFLALVGFILIASVYTKINGKKPLK